MKIEFKDVPVEGLQLRGELPSAELEFGSAIVPKSDVQYDFDVGANAEGLWVTGQVVLDVELECVRCLEKFIEKLRVEPIAWQFEKQGEEVDLDPAIREDLLLAVPDYPHCDESGARICPHHPEFGKTEVKIGSVDNVNHPESLPEGTSIGEQFDQLSAAEGNFDFLVDSESKSNEVSAPNSRKISSGSETNRPKKAGKTPKSQ